MNSIFFSFIPQILLFAHPIIPPFSVQLPLKRSQSSLIFFIPPPTTPTPSNKAVLNNSSEQGVSD